MLDFGCVWFLDGGVGIFFLFWVMVGGGGVFVYYL